MPPVHNLVQSLPLLIAASVLACHGDDLIEPSLGTFEITASTAGADPDTDGYTVQVDEEPVQTIGPAGIVHTSDVVGDHTIRLDGVAANCAVVGENPRSVALSPGDTTTVIFAVTCRSTAGSLVVTSTTTGAFPDQNGYTITIDGVLTRAIGPVGRQTVDGISAGSHVVGLSSVAQNCAAPPGLNIEVTPGQTRSVEFNVDCAAIPALAFTVYDIDSNDHSIFVVNPDGSGRLRLTPDGGDERGPVWSRDKTKLAYAGERDLYIMHANDASRVRLTTGKNVRTIRWSNNDRMIAFESDTLQSCPEYEWQTCSATQLWVIGADGHGLRKLGYGRAPSWSADGQTLAFADHGQIHTIRVDGSDREQLTNVLEGAREPAWSPDGAKIAFVAQTGPTTDDRRANIQILVMNPDGSGVKKVSLGPWDVQPIWSPDGSKIAFSSYPSLESDVVRYLALADRDGGRQLRLTEGPLDGDPSWSPDGARLVFSRWDFSANREPELYVINADDNSQMEQFSLGLGAEPSWSSR